MQRVEGNDDARPVLRVLVYSDKADTRAQVLSSLGSRLGRGLPGGGSEPDLEFVEAATAPMVLAHFDGGGIDAAILDGEAAPAGGLGLAKQLRDEYDPCPPLVVLIARRADRWLADWSRADAVAELPVDPVGLPRTLLSVLHR